MKNITLLSLIVLFNLAVCQEDKTPPGILGIDPALLPVSHEYDFDLIIMSNSLSGDEISFKPQTLSVACYKRRTCNGVKIEINYSISLSNNEIKNINELINDSLNIEPNEKEMGYHGDSVIFIVYEDRKLHKERYKSAWLVGEKIPSPIASLSTLYLNKYLINQ